MTWTDWRSRVIGAVIVIQFAIPLLALVSSERPTRLGFQMYSGLGGPTVEVIDADGKVLPYNWRQEIASLPRPDLDWASSDLATRLCEKVPEAAMVVIRRNGHERAALCE